MKWLRTVGMAGLCLASATAAAGEVLVAVASNFSSPMAGIVKAFAEETGHRTRLAFGSSGKLYAQIRNGAPFEAFLSADQAKPAALEAEGLTVPGSRFTYAVGMLALWSADPEFIDAQAQVLKQGRFRKLALANPVLAPYGAAAVEVLHGLGLEQATRDRWVLGENIAQAYQFVDSGNADLGFVALSQVLEAGEIRRGSAWRVPAALHSPIRQDAVLLSPGAHSEAARALLAFMQGRTARQIMRQHGYYIEVAEH